MKIAILADALDLQNAGIHIYLREFIRAAVEQDAENQYVVVRAKAAGQFEGAEEIVLPVRSGLPGHQRWRQFTTIPKVLVQAKAEVVVEPAHFGPFNLPPRVKRVTIIHDLTPVLFPRFHPAPSVLSHRCLLPGILKRANLVIANSQNTCRDMEVAYPFVKGKTEIILPGREKSFLPTFDNLVLKKYGIRQPYLLSVGTIEPRKNLTTLLQAYETFRNEGGQPLQLVFAGQMGWKNNDFFHLLERSPYRQDIRLTGYVERADLPALYSQCRLFIYPSLYEGFGLPVLEAMSCGAPALVSQASSLPEVGGEAAAYFSPQSVGELASQLGRLTASDTILLKMSELSLRRAANFTWQQAAEKWRRLVKFY
jgi:glycosyltransferase involved in cell wall biosynthesis